MSNLVKVCLAAVMIPGLGFAQLVLSEVDLLLNKVELVNTGTTSIDASGWQWCNRVNGSPFYGAVSASVIDTNLSTAASLNVGAGEILVLDVAAGFLPNGNGELGLYNSGSFGSTTALEDYVLWGAAGTRDSVADAKGIWTDNEFIDVTAMTTGDSLQLGLGNPGNDEDEYFVGPSSLGIAQSVPSPAALIFDSGSITVSNAVFSAVLNGPSGSSVIIDSSSNLTNWTAVATNSLPEAGWEVAFPITTNARFYRARTDP